MICFFSVLFGGLNVLQATPAIGYITSARRALHQIITTMDSQEGTTIDPLSDEGSCPESIDGRIELRDVTFAYPARPEHNVYSGLNLTIEAGQTVALAGPSGAWFGVGFNASSMPEEPWAVIVDGAGAVTERKLGNHAAGTLLKPSVRVVSSTAAPGQRGATQCATMAPRSTSFASAAHSMTVASIWSSLRSRTCASTSAPRVSKSDTTSLPLFLLAFRFVCVLC